MRIPDLKTVLILGSGAIKIGEAGEFDYSTSQAIKALREEGIRTIVVNPNIATIHTDQRFADKVYSVPIRPEFIEEVIEKEKPDGILLGFGGQTALNCGMELDEKGILQKHRVRVLGTGINSIEIADNRELFKKTMLDNDIPVPKSRKATDVESALRAAREIGFPVIVRVAYTLGGQGSGVARDEKALGEIARRALSYSRIGQILVEEYLDKWKEIEYEVMRDHDDNCTIICNMENLDPMGIHTGDSIVVAPSQTLSNREYNILRAMGQKVIRTLGIVGECNIQFAVNPRKEDFRVIEVNSRLSRSSALASKATGYPIAYIAAKLSIGYTLPELSNKITGATSACFEPALDYIVVKAPRWDFQKFHRTSRGIGTQMKSVGEVMAIGRCFEEALQKAIRMLDIGRELTDTNGLGRSPQRIRRELAEPTDERIFYVAKALRSGFSINEIASLTGIDPWFLEKIGNILRAEDRIKQSGLDPETIREAKILGFSDRKISQLLSRQPQNIRDFRLENNIVPVTKQIDTLAAEWPAKTNYLYLTYGGTQSDLDYSQKGSIIVLGSGCYRIGSSVEFDWCCVNMAVALREKGREVVMVNCNPETVSTDFDVLDKLYFEELTVERLRDIIDKEQPQGLVVSVGGQTPNNLARELSNYCVVLGTSPEDIDGAEDRSKFSRLLDSLSIEQPEWSRVETIRQALTFARKIGYPVLTRPSYVLSGSHMNVAFDQRQLIGYVKQATKISKKNPVVISKFLTRAKEVEVDGVSDGSNVFIGAILEHIENAGVHSGDATISIPTVTIGESIKSTIIAYSKKIAKALKIKGPFNIQFLVKSGRVMVIECNLRASRSMPFVSKATGTNLMDLAANAITNGQIDNGIGEARLFAVKAPQFSFMRLDKADPITGVEMVSTGEVACFADNFEDAFLNALLASNFHLPKTGDSVLISMGKTRKAILPYARKLAENGYKIFATRHTSEELKMNGIDSTVLYKVRERKKPNILDYLTSKRIKLVINIPTQEGQGEVSRQIAQDEYVIRRKATEYGIPLVTNIELAIALVDSLLSYRQRKTVTTASAAERTVTNQPETTGTSDVARRTVAPVLSVSSP